MNKEIEQKAEYCLNCPTKPCSKKGCPLNNDIPEFIKALKAEKYEEAYKILSLTTVLPAICGRICPHYKQCMGFCVRGIKGEPVKIGELEAFVGDFVHENGIISHAYVQEKACPTSTQIAIIGGGPAGLTAAAFLARKGFKITIYEKYNYLGGLLVHGIPEFRLPRKVTKETIKRILELGIDAKYNKELGKNLDLKDLQKEYDYIILAFGANISTKTMIEGENLEGVYGANELLEYNSHPDYTNKTVIINGGGNVAIDVARTVKRLGAKKVTVVYRRAREQMPAEKKEIEDAIKENIEFLYQHNIIKIIGNKKVEKIELIKTELIKKEGEIRPIPVNIKNSNYTINADIVVQAIGSHPSNIVKTLGVELNEKGYIKTNEYGQTSIPKVFAIGDIAGNTKTVAWAARSGRNIAENIIKIINKKKIN